MKFFLLLLCIPALLLTLYPPVVHAQSVSVGNGSYTTQLPAGRLGPSFSNNAPAVPKVTGDFSQPVQTNEFWSSLIFPFFGNQHSNNLFAHPAVFRAQSNGLDMGHPLNHVFGGNDYIYPYSRQLTIGIAGLNVNTTRTQSYGDWTVTARWDDGTRRLEATIGHGLPFAFFQVTGGPARIQTHGTTNIWHNQDGVIGVSVDGRHYGIFAPHGSSWSGTTALESTLNGQNYLSVALLPDSRPETLEFYRKRAYAHVTDSRVSWQYDESAMQVISTFTYTTTLMEDRGGNLNQTLSALYRHQWKYTDDTLTSYTYPSRGGTMKVFDGNTFTTRIQFDGVLPSLPDAGSYNRETLLSQLRDAATATLRPVDTYNSGKEMGRFARLVHIADQLGAETERDQLLAALKTRLQDWLTAGGDQQYVYNATWNVLTGYPASFGSDREINDHGFHAGYAVMTAATIAQYDPEWALEDNWGGMVNLVIRDANNWDRDDTRFPFLRGLNPYAGHSWASGHGDFPDGNNQESSSESMHFASAVVLWGAMTGQQEIRDLGIYLHATERTAVEQYWFDVDDAVFPANYPHNALGMVWGGKGTYGTWFGGNPEFIHGINMLPITGGSLYLGRHPDYVLRNVNEIYARTGGQPGVWRDVIWMFMALSDPDRAMTEMTADPNYDVFDGESRAHTLHWISNLQEIGRPDTSVSASVPLAAVFIDENEERTYVAFNTETQQQDIRFSDGYTLRVGPRQLGWGDATTTSQPEREDVPAEIALRGNFPNPFNPVTTLRYSLPETMQVQLDVYNVTGRHVSTLYSGVQSAGNHEIRFNAAGLSSGLYLYRLRTPEGSYTGSMTLIK